MQPNKQSKWKSYLKKLGIIGFIFFLIKGLIWLGVFYWIGSKF
jgi:hypothetical protein